ncbi:MAG: cation:proton antiporter [Candidatus Dormibacteraeota bacterium]|uniref:Cation:proton antiporter n=1 Tax=Candidatus Aeolococcus gillhamiae TaxID=3127015 RepID=A0A934JXW9_9BACT|nr:cation:proton antiporter [Candidatus Dormibacteraeota bacterium]
MNNIYGVAALWIGLAFVASAISPRIGISVALVEILLGVFGGNVLGMATNQWIDFLAGFGSILLTFLAGAEIDPASFRRFLAPSLAIGGIGFALPFAAAWAFALYVFHWQLHASEVAGIALSTTSVAVVYAVMIETGLNKTDLGKLILTACFVCDLGTVLALGVIFANYNALLIAFGVATALVLVLLPRVLRSVIRFLGHGVSEPDVKFVFLLLFGLGALATAARSEAVLPAYLLGLVAAGVFHEDPKLAGRVRGIALSFLTPFFFLKAGTLISLSAVVAGIGSILLFFGVKVGAKVVGVFPATRLFKLHGRQAWYTTMMMSTGLTFGSISALFGYTHGYIDRSQYSVLVTVVVLTALVPTFIAQSVFRAKETELLHGQSAPSFSGRPRSQEEPDQALGAAVQERAAP